MARSTSGTTRKTPAGPVTQKVPDPANSLAVPEGPATQQPRTPGTSPTRLIDLYGGQTPITVISPKDIELLEELVGAYEGYNAPSYRLAPYNPDQFIASHGFDVLEQQLDIQACRTGLNIARATVLHKQWEIQPAVLDQDDVNYADAKKFADQLNYCLTNIVDDADNVTDFRSVIFDLLAAMHYGFKISEIGWRVLDEGDYAGSLGFDGFDQKPCKQIGFDLDPHSLRVKNITSFTPLEGYNFNIPVAKCLRYTFQGRNGMPHGHAIGRTIYKHTWSIDKLTQLWNLSLEVFGFPIVTALAPPHLVKLAQGILAQVRQGAFPVFPQGVEATMMESTGQGTASFETALTYHGDQCSMAYLGSTMTTGSAPQTGTQALGTVQQGTSDFVLGYVRTDIENVIKSQLIRRWMRYNFGKESLRLAPSFSLGQWDSEDMTALTGMVDSFVKNGVMLPDEPVIRQRAGIPPMPPDLKKRRALQIQAEDASTKHQIANPGGQPQLNPQGTPPTNGKPPANTPPAKDNKK